MIAIHRVEQCIKDCLDCYRICARTLEHCLGKGGPHAEPGHVQLLIDCMSICRSSADFMVRGSRHHPLVCRACAEICRECARDCRRIDDDREMQRCAEMCERCATECERMTVATV